MLIKNLIDEDFINYKKAAMFVAFPYCSFKCEKDCGVHCCQNSELAKARNIDVSPHVLTARYMDNPVTSSIVFGGLEPFDSFEDMFILIKHFRLHVPEDDIVIYTGYNEDEIVDKVKTLSKFKNIIIKYGRFIPNDIPHFDEVLGVNLASKNQYAKRIS